MKSILFNIVLYKCSYQDCLTFKSLVSQLDSVKNFGWRCNFFFYDNSPNYNKNYKIPYPNLPSDENRGVSTAYNKGAEFAKEKGYEWIVLLDQDTEFPQNYLEKLVISIHSNPNISVFVPNVFVKGLKKYISPGYMSLYRTIPQTEHFSPGLHVTKNTGIINSGLCISVTSFYKTGGYNPDVYLDFSDTHFFEKIKRHTKLFFVLDIEINQNFSALEMDLRKVSSRYEHYCKCAKNYPKETFLIKIKFFILVFCKTIMMSLRYKSLIFFRILTSTYFK